MSMSEDQEQYQAVINLLDKVVVSRSDSCVNITLTATITEIEDFIQSSSQSLNQTV